MLWSIPTMENDCIKLGGFLFAVLELELQASNMLGRHWPLNCILSLMKRVVHLVKANNCHVEPDISVLLCAYFIQAHLIQATHCVHKLFHVLPNWGVAFIHRGQMRMLSSVLLYTLCLFSLRQDCSTGLDLGWQAATLSNLPLQHWGYGSIWQHPVFFMSSGDSNSDPYAYLLRYLQNSSVLLFCCIPGLLPTFSFLTFSFLFSSTGDETQGPQYTMKELCPWATVSGFNFVAGFFFLGHGVQLFVTTMWQIIPMCHWVNTPWEGPSTIDPDSLSPGLRDGSKGYVWCCLPVELHSDGLQWESAFCCCCCCCPVFGDRVLLRSPDCPGIHFEGQAGLELTEICLPLTNKF